MLATTKENQPLQNPLTAHPFLGQIKGEISFGGDKSISHRAIILSSLACGRSEIKNLSQSSDVAATINIMRQCGVAIESTNEACIVDGVGLGGLLSPDNVLDCGNSGTAARLLLGVLASHKISCCLTGDSSLCARPMFQVMNPLKEMGANFIGTRQTLPLILESSPLMNLTPIIFASRLPSAQLKSAILLAGLNIAGETIVVENTPTRDHTERMLDGFGGDIENFATKDGVKIIVKGQKELHANSFTVPGDTSSAAFFAALTAMSSEGELTLKKVGVNVHRMGFYNTLKKMGADIEIIEAKEKSPINEPVADIKIKAGPQLLGIDVAAAEAVAMIDEYPILSVVAAHASGTTNMRQLSQLRIKESDRLTAISENLRANGVAVEIRGDDLTIIGCGGRVPGGGFVKTYKDHRIAMAFLIQGAMAENPITIDDSTTIKTSFPDFEEKVGALGIVIKKQ